jgi:hypothetical protein
MVTGLEPCRHARKAAHAQDGHLFQSQRPTASWRRSKVVISASLPIITIHVLYWRSSFDYMKLRKTSKDWACCNDFEGTRTQIMQQQRRRRRPHGYTDAPQSWMALKFTVGIAAAIIGYCSYVYVGRFCLFMIQKRGNALGGRVTGSECPSAT